MNGRYILAMVLAMLTLAFSSCRHKDLWDEDAPRVKENVVFDWRNAPDANPSSMLTYFFPEDGTDPLIYTFDNREGGELSIPLGRYTAISVNGDNSDWASMVNTDDPENFEIITKDAEELEGYSINTRSIPRAKGTEHERIAKTPSLTWSDREDNVNLHLTGDQQTITFYPEENDCHYSVEIRNVKNIENLHGAAVDATISGMAEGYFHGKHTSSDVTVTMPFILIPTPSENILKSEFLTFGECNTTAASHFLTVYMYLNDGTKWFKNYDVTSQVKNAPDPKHVKIIVDGLDLPKSFSGGGFKPDVKDWNDIEINIRM